MKELACIRGCGAIIYFDDKFVASTGKKIPLEKATGKPHDCPLNPFNQKKNNTTGQPLQLIIDELKTKLHSLEERVARLETGQNVLGKYQ